MSSNDWPEWLKALNEEDLQFLKRFVLHSGSLKALALEYGVSYPTVRARVDRLIAKVQAADRAAPQDAFHRTLQVLVAEGSIAPSHARALLNAHRDSSGDTNSLYKEE
jgi:hypothetical protein